MLAGVFDRLGQVIAALYATKGIKPPKMKPLKRPETAYERILRNLQELEKRRVHESIVSSVLTNREPTE